VKKSNWLSLFQYVYNDLLENLFCV
jgi:hypothetical protein